MIGPRRALTSTPYAFLKNSIKEMLVRERKRKNCDRIARSHGDKYGAAASPRSTSPSHRGGRERSQSPRGSRPKSPSRGRSQSPNKSRTPSPKGVCYDFLKGTCKRGKNCPFLHKKRSLSPGGQRTPKKINKTCKFGSLERAQRATSVGFSIKMLKRLLLQPRNRRPHLQHQSRDPQGLIPQLPSQEEEAQDQSREGNPTNLQLAPLRQRPREDLRMILRILGRLILRVEG